MAGKESANNFCSGDDSVLCSVIIPVFNAATFVDACLESVLLQKEITLKQVEVVIFDDSSTDGSYDVIVASKPKLDAALSRVVLIRGRNGPSGVGFARNRACEASAGRVLIFQDADDVMRETRLCRSLRALSPANADHAQVVGGIFDRIPAGSTPRYENYHRALSTADLFTHAFRDAPLAMPTIACLKIVWQAVGGFVDGTGVPEDLHFLYAVMQADFKMRKLQGASLTGYRFHNAMTSLFLHRRNLLDVRVKAFESLVLSKSTWRQGFSIWNSGRDGKDVYKRLSDEAKCLVRAWGDVDPKKIGKLQRDRPVVHFSKLSPPIVCCVALDREGREFEANLASLQLEPGVDYVHLI